MASATVERCLNCSLRLTPIMRRLMLSEIPINLLNILRDWISPTPISTEGILCNECFTLLQNALTSSTPALGHKVVCYGCGVSILRSRTHKVPIDCPQRVILLRSVPSHQVTRLEKVCRACWMTATRTMQRQQTDDADRSEDSTAQNQSQEHMEQNGNIGLPPPLLQQNFSTSQPELQVVNKIHSRTYKRVAATPNHCLFSDCNSSDRLLVPSTVKELLIQHYKIYVPLSARICNFHLHNNMWDELSASYSDFTGDQMDDMMALMENAVQRQVDLTDIIIKREEEFKGNFNF